MISPRSRLRRGITSLRAATRSATGRVRTTIAPGTAWFARAVWPSLRPGASATAALLGVVTGFGWTLLALSIALWLLGRSLGWQEFTVLAVVGFTPLLLAIAFVAGRSMYGIELHLTSTRVVVGERAIGRVDVSNRATRALLPATIEVPVGATFASFHLPRLAVGSVHEDLFFIPTSRRSVLTVGPVRSVRGDALGLMRRVVRWTKPELLFVHPRTVNLDGASSGFLRDLEGLPTRDLSQDDVSFHALREYVSGDDLRHVHWKSSARNATGALMIRQFEETRRSHLAIALSTNSVDYSDPDDFELAISVCGSLGLQALREEKQLSVLVQGATVAAGSGKRLLDSLSGLDQRASRDTIVELARATGAAVPHASVVMLLCGGTVTATQLRAAASHIPLGVRVIVVSADRSTEVSRRVIGDVVVLTVADIADLPSALRRVG